MFVFGLFRDFLLELGNGALVPAVWRQSVEQYEHPAAAESPFVPLTDIDAVVEG